jgi:hypothetical protein
MGEILGDNMANNLSDVEQRLRGILTDLHVLNLEKALDTAPGKTFIGGVEYNKKNRKASKELIRSAIQKKFSKKYPLG